MTSSKNVAHESAKLHVTGEAIYIDDMHVNDQLLIGRVFYSKEAHAEICSYDLKEALAVNGVHAILTHEDIPGENQMGPVVHDELVMAIDEVSFIGQAVFIIAAETEAQAIEAERKIKIEYKPLDAILSIEDAMAKGHTVQPTRYIKRGDVEEGFAQSEFILEGSLKVGGQEQWYLETQVALAVPGEERDILCYSSTQNPSETQALIAEVLGLSKMEVEVQIRRMGGAFGGKETQGNHVAIWASLLAQKTKRPVKIRLFRDDDQKMTGKRHRYLNEFKVGYNRDGSIKALQTTLNADAGSATDLSMAVLERAMMHAENAYYIPHIDITGNAWYTNLPSNTAFRGFGGPQGMASIEQIVDIIARKLNKDAAEIRKANFYGIEDRNTTPYDQVVEHNRLPHIYQELLESSDYKARRASINDYNAKNEFFKKGMAFTPVKFGISFTTSFLNQAGALVNIYKDGTVLVNHGGTEMGQGLHTKMRQIAAIELGIDVSKVKVNATNTSKVPNTSATAASAGTDLNGMAVKDAADKLKLRIAEVVCGIFNDKYSGEPSVNSNLIFLNNEIKDSANPERAISFQEAVLKSYLGQVSLGATGFYKTPDIWFDRENGTGHPYYYFSFGMAVTEVLLDVLTGHYTNLRTDILHDVGSSVNERLDIGQVEGGYIQGVGWCTTEELKWDAKGNLLNHSPDTYKIPNIQDVPDDFRTNLLKNHPNGVPSIHRSKAVAEPPLMLGFACWLAIKDAISAVGEHKYEPVFELPATNEVILKAIDSVQDAAKLSI